MKAVTWQGKRDARVEEVPDPGIRKADDVIVRSSVEAIREVLSGIADAEGGPTPPLETAKR